MRCDAMRLTNWASSLLKPRRIFYGWYIVGAGAVSNCLVIGIATLSLGALYEPMRQELGWSMAAIAAGVSVRTLETGMLSPFTGFFVDRLGPRKMGVTGVLILSFGLVLLSQTYTLWVYYLASLLIALGQSLGGLTAFSAALVNWFDRKRGTASGYMNTGNAFGYFIVPLVALLIVLIGWRQALLACAGAMLLIGLPMALVLRGRPEAIGLRPDGDEPDPAEATPTPAGAVTAKARGGATGLTVMEAMRTPAFYLLVLANISGGIALSPWGALQIPHLQNVGFTATGAAGLVALYGGFQILIRVPLGWLADIMGRRRMLMLSLLFESIGILAFAYVTPDRVWLIALYFGFFGLGHATWTILGQTIVADYFGTLRFATLRGLSQTMSLPVGIAIPIFGGWMFDQTGSYTVVFLVSGAGGAGGILWLLLIKRPVWGSVPQGAPATPAVR